MQKSWKIIETWVNGYLYESTQRELSNEYQHDRVYMIFKKLCVLVLWMKAAPALKGLILGHIIHSCMFDQALVDVQLTGAGIKCLYSTGQTGITGQLLVLYNWLIWRVLKLAFFFKKVFSLYLFWRLEHSEQRHLHVDIFLCDL